MLDLDAIEAKYGPCGKATHGRCKGDHDPDVREAITELRKLREESTQLDAVLLDRNMELVRLREENKDAEDQARVLRDELSHIADALGVAPYGGCYEQAEVLERAKALAKRVEALEKLLLDWRTEYGNGSIEREASRIAERRAGRAK